MADSPSELQLEIEKLERKHAEHPEGRFFVPLANAYRKMGDIETAEALLRSGVERHPDYLSAHIVLGRCLADRGAVGEAQDEFRFVLTQDPQNLIALRTLGELAVADGRPGEAAEWYRELLAVDPMNEDARQALDTLADAPAPELESEFRSGAGWWQAESPDDIPLDDAPAAATESGAVGDDIPLDEEPETATGHGGVDADESFAWGGYDDLPGLRAEDAAEEPGAADVGGDETAEPTDERELDLPAAAEPKPFLTFAGGEGDVEGGSDDDATGFNDGGSSEVVTETIAELYARQGLHERAAAVYSELIRRRGGDPALEQRLAEIERLGRADDAEDAGTEVEPDEPASELTLADEEALISPIVDGEEDDAFAASFAEGFTTVLAEEPESADVPEPYASFADADARGPEVDADYGADAGYEAEEEADAYTEHPLPELAPRPREDDSEADASAIALEASIAQFLGGLAAWRPGGPAVPHAEEPPPLDELPEATAWEPPAAEPAVGTYGEAAPWDTPALAEEEPAADLPYPEEAFDSASTAGTGPAEDEPFPWELPGAQGAEVGEEAQPAQSEIDPFFVDDVEPAAMRADEPLPEAPSAPEARHEPEPEARSAEVDQSEDEDLESFQAWLRSLKR